MKGTPSSPDRLALLAGIADDAGAPHLAEEARALAERSADGRFFVACVGEFKRGKSSLLNALVGAPVLPVGLVPVTAVVTVIRHGECPLARIRHAGGGWEDVGVGDLARYVTEEQNPENREKITAVEVFVPSALLRTGMCLVDTPGIGSVFIGNTEATRGFVPHIDAALVVLGADPPISADELALVTEVGERCDELFFVLNKADRFADEDLEVAGAFTRRVLSERASLGGVRLYAVSATERLAGQGPSRDWHELVDALATLARGSGLHLARIAEERGLALLAGRLGGHLDERREALLRPVEDSERRVELLRRCVAEAERTLTDLDHLFAAEQDRLARAFSDATQRFIDQATPVATYELVEACRAHPAGRGPALRRASVGLAMEIARRHLDAWRAEAEPLAERLYVRAMDRFVEISNDFLQQIRAPGDAAFERLPGSVAPEVGFRWRSRLFYKDLFQTTGSGPLTLFFDMFRTRSSMLRSVERVASNYLTRLLRVNANRIEADLNERVLESKRRFAFELRALLRDLVGSATCSLDHARSAHERGSEAVQAEVRHINALSIRLKALGISQREN